MSKKLKIEENNKISSHVSLKEPYCTQWKEDILFEFGHITDKKNYSFGDLLNISDRKALQSYFELLDAISKATWEELKLRPKTTKGGYEIFEYGCFEAHIADKYNKSMSPDTKLLVFRFGNSDKYRMIGYKSHNCSRVIHILGFDLDFTLYDHGK